MVLDEQRWNQNLYRGVFQLQAFNSMSYGWLARYLLLPLWNGSRLRVRDMLTTDIAKMSVRIGQISQFKYWS